MILTIMTSSLWGSSLWDRLPIDIQKIILGMKSYHVFEDELLRTTRILKKAVQRHTKNYEMFHTRKRFSRWNISPDEYPVDESAPHYEPHFEWTYTRDCYIHGHACEFGWNIHLTEDHNWHNPQCGVNCACRNFRLWCGWKRNECVFMS